MNSSKPFPDNKAFLNNKTVVKEVHGYTRNVVINILEKLFASGKNEDGKTLHFLLYGIERIAARKYALRLAFQ